MDDKFLNEDWKRHRMSNKEAKDRGMFDFRCEKCKSKKIEVRPLDIPYLNPYADNSDMPEEWRKELYANAERIDVAIMKAPEIVVDCSACKHTFNVPKGRLLKQKVSTWYNNIVPMHLGVEKRGRKY